MDIHTCDIKSEVTDPLTEDSVAVENKSTGTDGNNIALNSLTAGERILAKGGDLAVAIELFHEAIAAQPNSAAAYNDLSVACWQQNKPEQSLRYAKKAMELEPDNKVLVLNYFDILKTLGMIVQAKQSLKRFAERHPEDQEINELLKPFLDEEAERQAKMLAALTPSPVAEPESELDPEKAAAEQRNKERLALYFYSTDIGKTYTKKNERGEQVTYLSDILKKPMSREETATIDKVMQVGGLFTNRDSMSLYRLAQQTPHDARILELGSYRGRSSNALGHAVINTERILYCIDTWTTFDLEEIKRIDPTAKPIAESYYTVFVDFLKNTEWFQSQRRVLRGEMKDYGDFLPSKFFDLIFIDASHDYPNGCYDISVALRCLKPGGIICGHDYWMDFKGLIKAVDEKLFRRSDLLEYGVVDDTYGFWFGKFLDGAPV
jgi:predicted O-methyltransferase YrrM